MTNIKMLMTILVMCRVAKLVGLSRKPADPQKLTMSAIINLRGKNVVIALDKNDIFFLVSLLWPLMIFKVWSYGNIFFFVIVSRVLNAIAERIHK